MSSESTPPHTPRLRETARSAELYARALELIPGGVNSPVRAMSQIGRDPIFIEQAAGCELTDVDGNTYIDYVCSWGPLILGHADPEVIAAVTRAAARGTTYGAPTGDELELAQAIVDRVPSAEMVRMVSSGTEAAMSAVRLARAVTGRDKIIKFAGAYHGHSDGLLAQSGSGVATLGSPGSPGITRAQAGDTIVVPWNDRAAVDAACTKYGVAAIIAEPCPGNMGLIPAADGYLEFLRERATEFGAILIFDEVISGFRVAPGGVQETAGVTPDLTVIGKILGGGLPAAAFAGRREFMQQIAPAGDVYQAGTLSGNPLAMVAGLATLRQLDANAYSVLALRTRKLALGLEAAAAATGTPVSVVYDCGLLTVFFSESAPSNFDEACACDLELHAAWCRALLDRGIYPPPSQFEAWFPSLAHDEVAIDHTLDSAADAFTAITQ